MPSFSLKLGKILRKSMVKHTIRGKSCTVDVDIPAYMDEETKKVLFDLMKHCLDEARQKEALHSINNLMDMTGVLIGALKKVGEGSKHLEKTIREMVGTHLNHGFAVGKTYTMVDTKLAGILEEQQEEYTKVLEKLPKEGGLAVSLFYCINLGRMAYETGFMLGTFLSEEKVEKYFMQAAKKEEEYIG
jgi:hypothetical protein